MRFINWLRNKNGLAKVLLLAFVAMLLQDCFSTIMVVYESQYHGAISGLFDVLAWFTGIISSGLALEEIIKNGWRTKKSLAIIAAISAANLVGTCIGVFMGAAFTHHVFHLF